MPYSKNVYNWLVQISDSMYMHCMFEDSIYQKLGGVQDLGTRLDEVLGYVTRLQTCPKLGDVSDS